MENKYLLSERIKRDTKFDKFFNIILNYLTIDKNGDFFLDKKFTSIDFLDVFSTADGRLYLYTRYLVSKQIFIKDANSRPYSYSLWWDNFLDLIKFYYDLKTDKDINDFKKKLARNKFDDDELYKRLCERIDKNDSY